MKEILQGFKDSEIEIRDEQQQKKEIKLIGRQRKVRGLTLFEYNEVTKALEIAKYKKQDYSLESLSLDPSKLKISNKVEVNEHCIYFQALNRKNAERKLIKSGREVITVH
jgi:hypothetical protein